MGSYGMEYGGYLDPSDLEGKNLKGFQDAFYQSSYPQNAAFWARGAVATRFKVGDQTMYSMMYGDSQYYQSRRFFFNLIRRHVNMICGYQRKNRKSTITQPTLQTDALSDDYNAVLKWSENRDGFQEYLSQSFEGAVTTGQSFLHLYPDYTLDPISGDLFTDNVSYCNVLVDPYYRKQDLSDCNGLWRRRWVTKVGAKALLPGYASEIDKMKPGGFKDGRFPLQAELLNVNTNSLYTYDEFHYRTTREATLIIDPKSGESVEWEEDESEDDEMMERVLAQQPWLATRKVQVPTVKLVISLGGKVVYHGKNLLGIDAYPFIPTLCYHEPDIQSYAWKVTGIVANLQDAQYLYNRRKVIELQILESQANSGWIYQVDGVVDPKAFRQTGEGVLIPVKSGRNINEVAQRIQAPEVPASMIELSRSLGEDITKISGVNEELLGAATDDKSGILSMLRQGAGLTTLQTIFDKLDYTQRLYGKIRLQAIRKNFSEGKVASILGHAPDPRFFTSHSLKYSIAVEEGNYSASQRQTELQQLLHFKEIGMPIADKSILTAAFITNKKQVIADMEEQQKMQSQQQQQQAQQQAQVDQSKVMQAQAKTQLDMASAKEKLSKIDENEATAQYRRAESDLALLKEMIGLEQLDLDHFRQTLELAELIKMRNNSGNSLQKQQVSA